jgi:hypothetical protein
MMPTWVLILIFLSDGHAVGLTSVPGYDSERDCLAAGVAVQRDERVTDNPYIRFHCIVGPKK